MPVIYDNIDRKLLPDLKIALKQSYRADFCIGYFNLRGWKHLADSIDPWDGQDGRCVRLLIGMHHSPSEELREFFRRTETEDDLVDNATIIRNKKKLAREFKEQLTVGIPTNDDEAALRKLVTQMRAGKVVVKLFIRYPLHAKLYLTFRNDPFNPIIGFLGSSNLTMAGLSSQGELNIDVLDGDAAHKLSTWFDDRWNENGCVDITKELIQVIDESWAREVPIPPYQIYINMAYHLSQEARAGLNEFKIPADFRNTLFDYQVAAVKIAAHHLNKRGGVLIGDVVGLGKTLMATALARIFEDDYQLETLIICPKNLVTMWEDYRETYHMRAKVMSVSQVITKLPETRRYRVLILDESHNLRNRDGHRFRAIQDYIQANECKCILLSATPYNKSYQDLSSQLRLFVPPDKDLGIRPERKLREMTEFEFIHQHQCGLRTLAAFEKSEFADDWRELMRLYMVRRTRSFITQNYARFDETRKRHYLQQANGTRNYFPIRRPRRLTFEISEGDQYALMYQDDIVATINNLSLPRYGLGNYVADSIEPPAAPNEKVQLDGLSRAGKRLMGFCRTNLFKRLESSGAVFLESIERHIQRNYIFLYALDNGLPLPIGTQDASLLDPAINDEDIDQPSFIDLPDEDEEPGEMMTGPQINGLEGVPDEVEIYKTRAKEIYTMYAHGLRRRFRWINSRFFSESLKKDLEDDARNLISILHTCGEWNPAADTKLNALEHLLKNIHPHEKVLIFTQFADTVRYIETNLRARGFSNLAGVTGDNSSPTDLARRFSPVSNHQGNIDPHQELRILVATDVLSEGQNLQDAAIVVNYDLPWAIVRLIQRAGRVDRIGQQQDTIHCYSFLPADGVERIIRLRHKVQQRLRENSEVLGTDETFFDGEDDRQMLVNLYNENAGLLDDDPDGEVDLASTAYQIWKNAIDRDPGLKRTIEDLSPIVYSAKAHTPRSDKPAGALVYVRTPDETDALAWVDENGQPVTESQFAILRAAECPPDEPALPRAENHHDLTDAGVSWILQQEAQGMGTLGNRTGARYRVYTRMKEYIENNRGTLFVSSSLEHAVDELYQRPLRELAKDALNRQLRGSATDEQLAEMLVNLHQEGRLCVQEEDGEGDSHDPVLICSMGLVNL